MFNNIPLKVKLVIIFLIIFISVLVTTLILFPTPPSDSPPQPPTPPASKIILPNQEPNYTGPLPSSVYQISTPESDRLAKINELNGQLLKKLPYTGDNFSLVYDYNRNAFIATINQNAQQVGNEELLSFLRSNGIENTDWLINFTTEIK